MEYLMTYGWAILVVIIVGIVLWQMGVLNPGASTAPGFRGFGMVRPIEYLCTAATGANDTVQVVVRNTAGASITGVEMTLGASSASCTPATVPSGETATCTINNVDCGAESSGDRFEVDIAVAYTSATGLARSSAGTIWGPAE